MFARVEMFCRVLVLRGIAAADVAAFHAEAQVDPGVAGFDAVFADVSFGGGDLRVFEMTTFGGHE